MQTTTFDTRGVCVSARKYNLALKEFFVFIFFNYDVRKEPVKCNQTALEGSCIGFVPISDGIQAYIVRHI
jgi:hypothetical protein